MINKDFQSLFVPDLTTNLPPPDKIKEAAEKYANSDTRKKRVRAARKKLFKEKITNLLALIKSNIWNILSLSIGIVTLIFSILAYLKASL